jgi:hypothetical protein
MNIPINAGYPIDNMFYSKLKITITHMTPKNQTTEIARVTQNNPSKPQKLLNYNKPTGSGC